MNKKINIFLYTIICILALYGLILLIRKIMLAPETPRMNKKDLGSILNIEPYDNTSEWLAKIGGRMDNTGNRFKGEMNKTGNFFANVKDDMTDPLDFFKNEMSKTDNWFGHRKDDVNKIGDRF